MVIFLKSLVLLLYDTMARGPILSNIHIVWLKVRRLYIYSSFSSSFHATSLSPPLVIGTKTHFVFVASRTIAPFVALIR